MRSAIWVEEEKETTIMDYQTEHGEAEAEL